MEYLLLKIDRGPLQCLMFNIEQLNVKYFDDIQK